MYTKKKNSKLDVFKKRITIMKTNRTYVNLFTNLQSEDSYKLYHFKENKFNFLFYF